MTHYISGYTSRTKKLSTSQVSNTIPRQNRSQLRPSSALLFPSLCAPTDPLDMPQPSDDGRCGDWAAMMPKRRRTRAQNRAHRVTAERAQNREARIARREAREAFYTDLLNP